MLYRVTCELCIQGIMLDMLRLAVLMALNGSKLGALVALGIECSTFVAINKGTSKRDAFNGWGNPLMPSVAAANKATSRPAFLSKQGSKSRTSASKVYRLWTDSSTSTKTSPVSGGHIIHPQRYIYIYIYIYIIYIYKLHNMVVCPCTGPF